MTAEKNITWKKGEGHKIKILTNEGGKNIKLFTPLYLCLQYKYGSRGPAEADAMALKNNFVYTGRYQWKGPQ